MPKQEDKNRLCLTMVARNSHATDKPVALEFPIELEFRRVIFVEFKAAILYRDFTARIGVTDLRDMILK